MYVIAHRISCVSRIQGSPVIQDELPTIAHLWSIFYTGMAASIMSINRALGSPNAIHQRWIFTRIVDVLSVEVSVACGDILHIICCLNVTSSLALT